MRTNAFVLLAISSLVFGTVGCVNTVDNRKLAGNPIGRDKLIRVYERPVLQCWAAAKDVLSVNGTIIHEDVMQSTLTAHVDTRTVLVKTESIDPKMTRVTLQVRTKFRNADLDLAGEIDKQIALRLTTGQTPMPAGATTPAK